MSGRFEGREGGFGESRGRSHRRRANASGRGRLGPDVEGYLRSLSEQEAAAPDLTSDILARVEAQRPFLSKRGRGWVRVARVAAGAGLCAAAAVAVGVYWYAPKISPVFARPAPLTNLVASAGSEARTTLENVLRLRNDVPRALGMSEVAAAAPSAKPERADRFVAGESDAVDEDWWTLAMNGDAMLVADNASQAPWTFGHTERGGLDMDDGLSAATLGQAPWAGALPR